MGEFKTVDLGAIRARWEASTRGDWVLDRPPTDGAGLRFRVHVVESGGRTSVLIGAGPAKDGLRRDDAVFVVEAHRDVPALVNLVEHQTRALMVIESTIRRAISGVAKTGELAIAHQLADVALNAAGKRDALARELEVAAMLGAR